MKTEKNEFFDRFIRIHALHFFYVMTFTFALVQSALLQGPLFLALSTVQMQRTEYQSKIMMRLLFFVLLLIATEAQRIKSVWSRCKRKIIVCMILLLAN